MEIDSFDMSVLQNLASSKKISLQIPDLIQPFLNKASLLFKSKYRIILPHKCCLAALIACCYETIGMVDHMDLWLLMTGYLIKVHQFFKTHTITILVT